MQYSMFDFLYPKYKITKPIRLIELFAGYGSQRLAFKRLGVQVESWKICEWAVKSIQAYNDIHEHKEIDVKECSPETLFNYGISMDYNQPMTLEQIAKKGEKWRINVLKNILQTNNLVNIQNAKAEDFEIVDKDKYEYILTYSFPCQSLSIAGKREGMDDTSTRSGMLWEVERILNELKQTDSLPQVLLMENVPSVHDQTNVSNFNKWQLSLEKLGYKNYFDDLNAKDYGVPQNRNRCFMISILGDYSYSFPQKQNLKLKLKDLLEDDVDEKYYLTHKMINCFMSDGTGNYPRRERFLQNIGRENQDVGNSVTTLAGNRATDNFVLEYGNKALNETLKNNQVEDRDFIDAYNRKVKKDVAGTITTRVSESNNTFVATEHKQLDKEKLCDYMIENKLVKEGDVVNHNYSKSRMEKPTAANCDNPDCSPTLTTRPDTLGVVIKIKNKTSQGYLEAEDGDGVDISGRMEYHRGTVQKGMSQTLLTSGNNTGVVVVGNYMPSGHNASRIVDEEGLAPTVMENHGTVSAVAITDNYIQWKEKGRLDVDCRAWFEDGIAPTTTTPKSKVVNNLRIRKLSPRECWRLMGVDDSDYDKVAKNQSEASLYHLAGDSIVVDVLVAIFKELL